MIRSDKIDIIVAIAVVFALIISLALVGFGNAQAERGVKTEPQYAAKIFGPDIISIEIIADEEDWQEMLDNARNEQFIMADAIVNGTKFEKVGVRPKGNSSLSQVASSNSDRYSFRLQFDEYIKGQTCFGLESFVVNNMLGDNTYMKEYISYDLMREAGVDVPYFGYADIKVNGESWGLYLAVELYNDSYEQRVFGDASGMLYNVKSMDMGGGQRGEQDGGFQGMPGGGNFPAMPWSGNSPAMPEGGNFPAMPWSRNSPTMPEGGNIPAMPDRQSWPGVPGRQSRPGMTGSDNEQTMPNMQDRPEMPDGVSSATTEDTRNAPAMPDRSNGPAIPDRQNNDSAGQSANQPQTGNRNNNRFGFFGGRGGGSLEYTDDNTSSYGSIFNNVVGKGTEEDYQRVVEALKALSEGKDLETYFDVDQILRYLAAHTVVVNLDSYSSMMAQNYYIYERDGQITILPWDYNLAWGGFQSGSASSVINFPIDTPVSGVDMSNRPLIDKLFSNPEYLDRYHGYLQQLMDNYFANGKFAEKINELDALISEYVKNDVTKFCTYDEYKTAVSAFITLGELRAQSVQGQLDGTIPSTTAGQNADPGKLIPAGDLRLSDLGSMMGGRGGNNMGFPGGWGAQFGGQFSGIQGGQSGQTGQGNRFGGGMQQNSPQTARPGNNASGNRVPDSNVSENAVPDNSSSGNAGRQGRQSGNMPNRQDTGDTSNQRFGAGGQTGRNFGNVDPADQRFGAGFPSNQGFGAVFPGGQQTNTGNLALTGGSILLLIGAIIFAARYKKCY